MQDGHDSAENSEVDNDDDDYVGGTGSSSGISERLRQERLEAQGKYFR